MGWVPGPGAGHTTPPRGAPPPAPTPGGGPEARRYQFRLGVRAGFGGGEAARLPIHHRPNVAPHPVLKEIYSCEVAGQTLEAANLFALRDKVASVLETIAPARALPLAYFRVPAVDYSLPVYEDDGQIVSPVLAGPKLKAPPPARVTRAGCPHPPSGRDRGGESAGTVGGPRPRGLPPVRP